MNTVAIRLPQGGEGAVISWTIRIRQACAMVALALLSSPCFAAAPRVPDGVEYLADVHYGDGGDTKLHLDLAKPKQLDAPAPCIVIIHGGAWRGGNKSAHTNLVLEFAKKGCVAASVQYRFCPQHTFPAQIEDVKCAVRYLRAHHEKYGIDPQRFGALGFSAGAHLSMLLGVMGKEDGLEGKGGWSDQTSQVQAVVSFFGPTDLKADDLPEVSQKLVRDFLGGSVEEKAELYELASPVHYTSRGDAPMLLLQGTKDPLVPHTQAYKMADALTGAGVPGRVELFLGAGHGWGGDSLVHSREETNQFFDKHLRSGK